MTYTTLELAIYEILSRILFSILLKKRFTNLKNDVF